MAGVVVAVSVGFAGPSGAQAVQPPGVVTETVSLSGVLRVEGAAAADRVTYWSRGPRAPMQSTAAIYLPPGSPPPGGWPIVAYAHGSVGIADQCAFTLTPRDFYLDTVYPELLRAGFAVVISDYVGLGTPGTHPYLDGPSQARSVIDGVRAARSVHPELGTEWAVFGQSQGGQTALFTSAMASDDAPELQLRGAVATGVPSSLEAFVSVAGPWIPHLPLRKTTTYFALLLAGLRATAPELNIDSYLTPTGRRVLGIVESECVNEADAVLRDVAIGEMLTRRLEGPELNAAATAMLRIPTQGQTVPLFIGQGVADLEVPAPLTAKLIADLQVAGADLRVGVYPGDHLGAPREAMPDALAFLREVLHRT